MYFNNSQFVIYTLTQGYCIKYLAKLDIKKAIIFTISMHLQVLTKCLFMNGLLNARKSYNYCIILECNPNYYLTLS